MPEFHVIGCPRCRAKRVVPAGQKTSQCPRCGAKNDLEKARTLFSTSSIEKAQAFLGETAARDAGDLSGYRRDVAAPKTPSDDRSRELRGIASSVGAATGRANQLKLILRRGFEAFGELQVEDLEKIAREAGFDESGEDLAQSAVEFGLAGRTKSGTLVPLREGR